MASYHAAMRQRLIDAANPDGGWGYFRGRASRLEPTCWVLLSLTEGGAGAADWNRAGSERFLTRLQSRDGLLLEDGQPLPNLAFNGLAALLLLCRRELFAEKSLDRLLSSLSAGKGVKLPPSKFSRQDNTLQGWAWIDATFSWVEPTCWCLLALKKAQRRDAATDSRIHEAERLLLDRSCSIGGWNYGNSNVLGQELPPYVPTTALGLLALQDRRHEAVTARSLEYLKQHRLDEISGMALALTMICFRVFGLAVEEVQRRLLEQWERTGFLGNLNVIAMALYSLTGEHHGAATFRL